MVVLYCMYVYSEAHTGKSYKFTFSPIISPLLAFTSWPALTPLRSTDFCNFSSLLPGSPSPSLFHLPPFPSRLINSKAQIEIYKRNKKEVHDMLEMEYGEQIEKNNNRKRIKYSKRRNLLVSLKAAFCAHGGVNMNVKVK